MSEDKQTATKQIVRNESRNDKHNELAKEKEERNV